jgi:hypothetical protein
MLEFLRRLQKKPEAVRRRYALMFSGGVTAIIFGLWLTVVTTGTISYGEDAGPDTNQNQQVASPLESLTGSAESAFTTAQRNFFDETDQAQNSETQTESVLEDMGLRSNTSDHSTATDSVDTVNSKPYWSADNKTNTDYNNAPPESNPPPVEGSYWSE